MPENLVELLTGLQGALGGLVGSHASAGRWQLANSIIESGLGDLTSKIKADAEAAVEMALKLDEPLRSEVLELYGVSPSQVEGEQKKPRRRKAVRGRRKSKPTDKPKKGRPRRKAAAKRAKTKRVFSAEDEATIEMVIKANPDAATKEIKKILSREHKLKVSGQMIGQRRRHLKSS